MPPYRLKSWIPLYKLDWRYLSANPAAIDLLRENPEEINWMFLSSNPAAIDLLRENPQRINWPQLSENPAIFEKDPEKAATKIQQDFRKSRGYAAWAYSPQRLKSQGYFDNNLDFGKRRSTKSTKSTKRKSNTTNSGMSLKTIDRLIKLVQKM